MNTTTRKHGRYFWQRVTGAFFGVLILIVVIAGIAAGGSGKTSGAMSAAEQMAAHPHGAVARAYWQQSCKQNPHRDVCIGIRP